MTSKYHVHFGVTQVFERKPELPAGFITDGDSFLIWGEGDKDDYTLHVIALENEKPTDERVAELRTRLAPYVPNFGQRLFDYVVISLGNDWSGTESWNEPGDHWIWTPMEGEVELVG